MIRTIPQTAAASSSSNLNHDMSEKPSSGPRPRKQRPPFDPAGVKETKELDAYRDEGKPMLNNYTRHAKIGGGQHGEVWLCYQLNPQLPPGHPDSRVEVAIKGVKRENPQDRKFKMLRQQRNRLPSAAAHTPILDRLGTAERKIRKEIAIMKKCRHPHVVRLLEVIDDRMQTKVYMVMEYLHGGEVQWRDKRNNPVLSLAQTRRIMRDAILGLEYLHHQGIIHRDIKPANLLWTSNQTRVKIADFGVSHFSYAQRLAALGRRHSKGAVKTLEGGDDDEERDSILLDESDLSRRAGTPMFLAPEIIREYYSSNLSDDGGQSVHMSTKEDDSATRTPTMNGKSQHLHYDTHTTTTSTSLSQTGGPQSSARRPSSTPRPIDKAIDIWALGVTFYCLLFGRVPFRADRENNTEWGLYHAINNKEWTVRSTMGSDRVWCGSHPRRRTKEEDAQKLKSMEDTSHMENEAEIWRVLDDDDAEEDEDSGTEAEEEAPKEKDTGEGNQIVELLEKFLQRDPRNRITLYQAKRDPWFLVEIAHPEEWLELTTPKSKITVSSFDATEALQPVRFHWKWNKVGNKVGRRISSLFKSNKGPPKDPSEILGGLGATTHGGSRSKKDYDTARGPVKSDPAIKIRRHKSTTAASLARIQTTQTTPSSPDPTSSSWESPSPVRDQGRFSYKGKGRQRTVDPGEQQRAAAGKRLQSKSIDRWPTASRLAVSTNGPDPSSKSTSAIDDQVIAAQRRGSLPFLSFHRHHDPGTSNTNTQASSSIASSPTDATGAWTSNQVSRASSKTNFRQDSTGSKPRARFAQLIGTISSWRPSRFSSSSVSPSESEKNIKSGIASVAPPSTYNRAGMSEEALASRRTLGHSPRNIAPTVSGGLTPDRRASSWGQGDTPGDNRANMLGIPIVRSLDSALMNDKSGRIVSGMRGLSLSNGYHREDDDEEDEYSELGPACYDDDSSTIASGGEGEDFGNGIIRSDSGGEILQADWTDHGGLDMSEDGDSMIQEHVIHSPPYHSPPFGEVELEEEEHEEEGCPDSDSDDEKPVTFSPRKHR